MHRAAGRSRRRAKIDSFQRRSIPPPGRPQRKLYGISDAAYDVPAHQIFIPGLHLSRVVCGSGQNAIAETRSEALDLAFHLPDGRTAPAIRNMAVSPRRVFARGGARSIEQARLGQEGERPFGSV